MPTDADRLDALEAAVAELRRTQHDQPPPPYRENTDPADDDRFWLLAETRRRQPDGAVTFGGTATVGGGEVAWQWGAVSDEVLQQDWESAAGVFDALSHPVRLRLLQQVLNGTTTTAELAEDASMGTTGQLHHHLRALVAAGWLASTGRGRWTVPGPRVIPLLIMITAATSR